VDVELKEVEEFVGHEVDGAVEVAFDAEVELEGAACFVADGEGDVLELARGVCYLLGCVRYVRLSSLIWSVFGDVHVHLYR
jgi:hypothetical protein